LPNEQKIMKSLLKHLQNKEYSKVEDMMEGYYYTDPDLWFNLFQELMLDSEIRKKLEESKTLDKIVTHLPRKILSRFRAISQFLSSDINTYHSRINELLDKEMFSESIILLASLIENYLHKSAVKIICDLTTYQRNRVTNEVKKSNIISLSLMLLHLKRNRVTLKNEVCKNLVDLFRKRNQLIHSRYFKIPEMKCYQLIESATEFINKLEIVGNS